LLPPQNVIVDKNARIGQNCEIVNKEGVEESIKEDQGFYIRSGIVTVLKGATIEPGTII
jgi:glucose-1-phosphate adenylyltransferase